MPPVVTREMLEKRAAAIRTGGKGTVRRTVKVAHRATDDKKVSDLVKKLSATPMKDIDEATFFRHDGSAYVFKKPQVHTSMQLKCFIINGNYETKTSQEMLPLMMGDLQKIINKNSGI